MPLTILRNDITTMNVDAIVNAANTQLKSGGGVCGAIYKAAGASELTKACQALSPIDIGQAVITPGFKLKAKHIIHAAGPIYQDGLHHEKDLLIATYQNSLTLAFEKGCQSIAFPLISSGIYGYPKEEALSVAIDTIKDFLETHELDVSLVVYDHTSFAVSVSLQGEVQSYIDEHLIHDDFNRRTNENLSYREIKPLASKKLYSAIEEDEPISLDGWILNADESFSTTLLKLIDQKKMTDVEVYKKANLDRKHFSKIRSNPAYNPSKKTAVALAIALTLDLQETQALLEKAGYALSNSQMFDLIVKYFIQKRNYDVYQINAVLFNYDQPLLGA